MNINTNNYSIMEIINMLDRRELIVNTDYQRGSGLWPAGPSSYFIDTILEGYPFPKIYMYEYLDRSARGMRKEIVDGQQRIKTIVRYHQNEFALQHEARNAGLRFRDLDLETQERFLSYPVSVDVIRNASRSEILQMFRRMNAYTLPLNEAEKRHSSFEGKFKWFINELADELNEFFVAFGVFTNRQIVRMADAELLTDCVLAMERGVISTSPTDLRNTYRLYDNEFVHAEMYRSLINLTFGFIGHELGALRGTHMMKPYALHSLFTALAHLRFGFGQIAEQFRVPPFGAFSAAPNAAENLLALAQAHEAKEVDGPFAKYVWGCLAGTNRAPRRTARVAAILRALGAEVPPEVDAYLT
ncbi:DUF262 domain-containing protein [Bradyrhizobium neotropicale]|uniref:DUF262 domain-containing protein n=1 Tax=Bradyrhizobium neotropicale TaxID=1497615 RepID=UPI001AD74DDB|nr:DUF262 domain-containing protein [Bradyrhizobium neotropicale]MBO4225352.1 DUF262 domain-containing protein [Bradyrhizobium neotropicale]